MIARLALSEADWQSRVMDAARRAGWLCVHYRPARTPRGNWVTPLAGDKGAPDLLLAKDGRVLFAELKRDGGMPTPEQVAWLKALGGHGRIWRPQDWEAVQLDLGITKRAPLSIEDRLARHLDDMEERA